ncbi:MAG: HDOD domain-containing protein [Methylohalobius sp.]|nr:HDOD domain-containing protein [Methylohalobius sp.]
MEDRSLVELLEEQFTALSSKLPVFHPVALELERLKNDGRAGMDKVVSAIEKDPMLSAQILRLANSALYRGLTKAETISRAVMRLGMKRVVSLAFAASQSLAYRGERQPYREMLKALWSRTYLSACGARWLAERAGQSERAEEAFLAGLFHDLGELFVLRALESASTETGELTQTVIEEAVAALHSALGARLLLQWNLPEEYVRIARDHHQETLAEGDWLMACVRLMDLACSKLGIGQQPQPELTLAATPEAETLGLKAIALAELEVMLEDLAAEATSLSTAS